MAQITGLHEKQIALKKVTKLIESLEPLNKFLAAKNQTNEYTICLDKLRVPIYCDDKGLIDSFVKAKKIKIVEEIKTLSNNYTITLDEKDLAIMEGYFVRSEDNDGISVKAKTLNKDNSVSSGDASSN